MTKKGTSYTTIVPTKEFICHQKNITAYKRFDLRSFFIVKQFLFAWFNNKQELEPRTDLKQWIMYRNAIN